jgi:uncharacterized membrane protein YfcA
MRSSEMTDQERIALYQMAYKEASLGRLRAGARYAIGGSLAAALGVILATTTARDRKEAIRNSLMFGTLLGAMGGSMALKTRPAGGYERSSEPIKPEEWKKSKDDSPIGKLERC